MRQSWIILRNTDGEIVARFDDWISYKVERRVNDIDRATLVLDGHDENILYFGLDCLIEYWREDREANIEAYREAVTLHRTFNYNFDNRGMLTYTSFSVGLDDFLNRRVVYNYEGSARADKSDAAESAIKEYVDEQVGPSATVAGGRLAEGAITGLSIEGDTASGDTWSGSRAFENVFTTVKEIADSKDMAFWIELIDPETPTFLFRAKEKPYGENRSSIGLDPTTGRNSYGNYPVIFADQFDNIAIPSYGYVRDNEANTAVVIGRGNEDDRNVREVTIAGTTYDLDSPWNRREVATHATQETTNAAMDDVGTEALQTTIPQYVVGGKVMQHPSCMYGRDYQLGDIVTFRINWFEIDRTINGVTILAEGKEGGFGEQIDILVGND